MQITTKMVSCLSQKLTSASDEVKAKLSLYVISYTLLHEDVWGSAGIAPPFLTSELDGSEWSSSRSCSFNLGNHLIRGWVGTKASRPLVAPTQPLIKWGPQRPNHLWSPLNKRLSGDHKWSGRCGIQQNLFNFPAVQSVALRYKGWETVVA
jgi:hypothetical protein